MSCRRARSDGARFAPLNFVELLGHSVMTAATHSEQPTETSAAPASSRSPSAAAAEGASSHSPSPAPSAPLSNTARDRARHRIHEHGNYHNYYHHRSDDRLALLPPSLFAGQRVLDLGCNAGNLTLQVLESFGALKARGVDIDPVLIGQAEAQTKGDEAVEWELADFMQEEYDFGAGQWDTIMLLSITKWLHLHHLDEGMRKLFRRLFEALPRGGVLLVEPQERENYASAARKNKDLKPAFR